MSDLDDEELRATRKLNGVDICEGDYIRTLQGTIAKIEDTEFDIKYNFRGQILYENWIEGSIYYEIITKHSPNLIDLVECGDYVNEHKVQQVFIDPFTKKKRLLIEGTEVNWQGDMSSVYCEAEEIRTIVTHEQFNSVMYKVKE